MSWSVPWDINQCLRQILVLLVEFLDVQLAEPRLQTSQQATTDMTVPNSVNK